MHRTHRTHTLLTLPHPALPQVVTVWIPLQRTTPSMGSLIFSRRVGTSAAEAGSASGSGSAGGTGSLREQQQSVRPKPSLDAWDVAALSRTTSTGGAGPLEEQSDAYDTLVSAALQADGCAPELVTYELGDASIHRTSCFHRTGPNLGATPRVILGVTYFADGAVARCDVDLATLSRGQRNDWTTFAPGVKPGDLVATKLNPLLPHAVPEGRGVFYT